MSIRSDLNDSCLLMLYRVSKAEGPEEPLEVEVLLGRKVLFNGITDDPTAQKIEQSGSANQRMAYFAESLKKGGDLKRLMKTCGIMYPGAGSLTYPGGRIKQTVKGAKQISEILAGYKGLVVDAGRKSNVTLHDEKTGSIGRGVIEEKDLVLTKMSALKEFYEEFLLTGLSHSLEQSKGENLVKSLLDKIELVFVNTFGQRKGFFFALNESHFLEAHKKERTYLESIMSIIDIGCLLDMSFDHYLDVVNNITVRAYSRNVKALSESQELSSQSGSIELHYFQFASAETLVAYYSEDKEEEELDALFKKTDKVIARMSDNPEMQKRILAEMRETVKKNHREAKAYIPLAAAGLTKKVLKALSKQEEEAKA